MKYREFNLTSHLNRILCLVSCWETSYDESLFCLLKKKNDSIKCVSTTWTLNQRKKCSFFNTSQIFVNKKCLSPTLSLQACFKCFSSSLIFLIDSSCFFKLFAIDWSTCFNSAPRSSVFLFCKFSAIDFNSCTVSFSNFSVHHLMNYILDEYSRKKFNSGSQTAFNDCVYFFQRTRCSRHRLLGMNAQYLKNYLMKTHFI
jgi:hypothetical protein